jgi:hypothetical protein
MPHHPLGERAMTAAERQARYRAARATGAPVIRTRRPTEHRSRAQRWHDAVATLTALQGRVRHLAGELASQPAGGRHRQALQAICDLGALQALEPPQGFGRD